MKKLFGILMLSLLFLSPVTVLARGSHGGHSHSHSSHTSKSHNVGKSSPILFTPHTANHTGSNSENSSEKTSGLEIIMGILISVFTLLGLIGFLNHRLKRNNII